MRTITVALCGVLALAACGVREEATANVGVVVTGIHNPDDVAEVRVTVSGDGFAPIVAVLPTKSEGPPVSWSSPPIAVPIGNGRTFLAQACRTAGCPTPDDVLFEGDATADIKFGETPMVIIRVTSTEKPPEFNNEAPIIKSLIVLADFEEQDDGSFLFKVLNGANVSMVAAAHDNDADPNDPDSSEPVTITWAATDRNSPPNDHSDLLGTPDNSVAGESRNTFSASQDGQFAITVTATDTRDASAQLTVALDVGDFAVESDVQAVHNFAPQVMSLTAVDSTLDVGESTVINSQVEDLDGDAVDYEWMTDIDCRGTFDTTDPANPVFTREANEDESDPVARTCTIILIVRDLDPDTGLPRDAVRSQGVGVVVIHDGAGSNGLFPMISNHEMDIVGNGAGGGFDEPNGTADDSQEGAQCVAGAGTRIDTLHKADPATGNRYLLLDYEVKANADASCGGYAAFYYPLVLAEARDLSAFDGLRFTGAAVAGTPTFLVRLRSSSTAGCTFTSEPITVAALGTEQVAFTAMTPSAACADSTVAEQSIESVSFVMDTVHAAQLSLDDVAFYKN